MADIFYTQKEKKDRKGKKTGQTLDMADIFFNILLPN